MNREQLLARSLDTPELYEVTAVEDADAWTSYSLRSGSTGFGLSKNYGVKPYVGDTIGLYTRNLSMIRGMDLNGEPIFYKTDDELEQERQEEAEKHRCRARERFARDKERLDAEFASLPEVFQRRIAWFREHNPRFRSEYEAYEMVCCVDAVKIAEWARSRRDPAAAVSKFRDANPKWQKAQVPDLAYDQHSGNTFGLAVLLAHHYVVDPELVYLEHGAMTPLTGCDAYGCAHPRKEN